MLKSRERDEARSDKRKKLFVEIEVKFKGYGVHSSNNAVSMLKSPLGVMGM